ncbi:MAG: hypothetical protein ACI83B_001103 [Sediminicola sp.]|jgi:hypothetical protein
MLYLTHVKAAQKEWGLHDQGGTIAGIVVNNKNKYEEINFSLIVHFAQ